MSNDEIDNAIRRAAGYPEAPMPPPEPTPDDALRALIARDAGLPISWSGRLRGDTPDALAADARKLADVVEKAQAEKPPSGSFDGGAHGEPPEGPPSMDSLIRAQVEARRLGIGERALYFDHIKNRNLGGSR
jgi:hypothetical protein